MGSCCCKLKRNNEPSAPNNSQLYSSGSNYYLMESSNRALEMANLIDELVLEVLGIIGYLVDNEHEPIAAIAKLQSIADKEDDWVQVVSSMARVIPIHEPLGPLTITLLLEDCPLPSKYAIIKMSNTFDLCAEKALATDTISLSKQRNICIILGCIAEKFAGPNSVSLMTTGTLDFLLTLLNNENDANVVMFALIALEKFAQTSENNVKIKRRLLDEEVSPLLRLETLVNSEDFMWRQVGFTAQWSLDNLFMIEGRQYSYQSAELSEIHVMLNTKDVSQYLKLGPDGLEARCDSHSFESVRCTFQVDEGSWYYETLIVSPGVMQIGWATKSSKFLNHEGFGIGDDPFSIAYDGCRCLIWYNAKSERTVFPRQCWCSGDILGCFIDMEKQEIIFSINGNCLEPINYIFDAVEAGFFAAASFMSFQQCRFNFGNEPFKFPPNRPFQKFNDNAYLTAEEKAIIPRHIYLAEIRDTQASEDSCTLCFDHVASMMLQPCRHRGFCRTCVYQLHDCPMCRGRIDAIVNLPIEEIESA